MSETRSAAATLFPNLPSSAAPAQDRPLPDSGRSAAESVYGASPTGGIDVARAVQDSGVAKPAAETAEPDGGDTSRTPAEKPVASTPLDTSKLKLPEGATLDPAMMADFSKIPGVTQANAQSFVDLHQRALTETSTRYWDTQQTQWETAVKADKEIGGDNLASVVDTIKPLLADTNLIDPGFVKLLAEFRIGSHPAVIRTLYRLARAL
jgi:hypothetical protein